MARLSLPAQPDRAPTALQQQQTPTAEASMIGFRDNSPIVALLILATATLGSSAAAQESDLGSYSGGMDYAPLWRVRGEYLYWWSNGNQTPPLVTTSPPGTPRTDAGVLGTPGVEILLGDRAIDTDGRSGGRVTISRWLEDEEETVFEFVGFYLGNDYQSGDFSRQSAGTPILSRPFFNIGLNQEDAELVAYPGVLAGQVAVNSYSEGYSGAALLRQGMYFGPRGRLDVIGGYRYFHWREQLTIQENLVSIDPGGVIPLNTTTDLIDRFATGNDFHGGELGLSAEYFWPMVSLEVLAKVAIGGAFRRAAISGETTVTVPGNSPQTTAGGLLALPTNIGTFSETDFGVLPEFGLNLTISLTPDISLITGYSLVVFNDVLRSGRQIDRVVNTSQIGGDPLIGPARPAFAFDHSNLVLQGLNFGLEYRW